MASSRILLNLSLDALLAILALPLALTLAGPGSTPPAAWWSLAIPLALLALMPPGWVLGLPAGRDQRRPLLAHHAHVIGRMGC